MLLLVLNMIRFVSFIRFKLMLTLIISLIVKIISMSKITTTRLILTRMILISIILEISRMIISPHILHLISSKVMIRIKITSSFHLNRNLLMSLKSIRIKVFISIITTFSHSIRGWSIGISLRMISENNTWTGFQIRMMRPSIISMRMRMRDFLSVGWMIIDTSPLRYDICIA